MQLLRLCYIITIVIGLQAPVTAANFKIDNPAEKIDNPAAKMYNPATEIKNPAVNIVNPAAKINNPNPASPVTPAASHSSKEEYVRSTKQAEKSAGLKSVIPQKNYTFKKVKEYINAAKKAFAQDDYIEFLSITEDALRRINSGSLKASRKTRQKLAKYKKFGYGLLEEDEGAGN